MVLQVIKDLGGTGAQPVPEERRATGSEGIRCGELDLQDALLLCCLDRAASLLGHGGEPVLLDGFGLFHLAEGLSDLLNLPIFSLCHSVVACALLNLRLQAGLFLGAVCVEPPGSGLRQNPPSLNIAGSGRL